MGRPHKKIIKKYKKTILFYANKMHNVSIKKNGGIFMDNYEKILNTWNPIMV